MGCARARLSIVLGIVLLGMIGQMDGLTTTKVITNMKLQHSKPSGVLIGIKLFIVFQYPPGHSSYTTTAENVFLAATTQQQTSSSSRDSSSKFSMSAFQPSLSSSSHAELLQSPPPSPLKGDTTVLFSVTVDGATAFCQLSFSTDFVCISYAEVGAKCLYPL